MPDDYNERNKGSFPPWSRIPSLKEMTSETGIDHDQFISLIASGLTAEEIARQMEISQETSRALYEHFMHYGISSVIGGD